MTYFYSVHDCRYTYTSVYGSTSSGSHVNYTNRRTINATGKENPGWKALVAQGLEAGSLYEKTVHKAIVYSSDIHWLYRWYPYNWAFYPPKRMEARCRYDGPSPLARLMAIVPRLPPDIDYSLEKPAIIAFLNKVRNVQSPFQVLPFLGELKETINMFRHPLRRIRQYTREYRQRVLREHRRLNKANELAGVIADHYLEWKFGVAPFLNDMEGIMEACKALFDTNTPKDIPVSVTLRDHSGGLLESPKSYYSVTGCYDTFISGIERKVKCQIKGAVRNSVEHPLRGILPTIGFSLDEFVPTVYELLPYSWLADYFSNVGSMLGAKAVNTSVLSWYWVSHKNQHIYHGVSVPSWVGVDPGSVQGMPRSAGITSLSFKRYKPPLEVRLLDDFEFHIATDVGQWLNITALAVGKASAALRPSII